LVGSRLARAPYIDGEGGLFAAAEGQRAVEARLGEVDVFALGLAALEDTFVQSLVRAKAPEGGSVDVVLTCLDGDDLWTETVEVRRLVLEAEVRSAEEDILERLDSSVADGEAIVRRASEMFPRIRFGQRAEEQIAELRRSEPVFRQLLRHLRALDRGAAEWFEATPFQPWGSLTFSPESKATLEHGRYGPMRDFPVPTGFQQDRWSLHTKLTGGNATRMYFRPERVEDGPVVLIGYFGPKLPTVEYPT
jgi:hypothetical protein